MACAAPQATQSGSLFPQPTAAVPEVRLPEGVRPLAYTLELSVLPKQARFSGRVQIAVSLDKTSDRLWLNGKDLQVSRVSARVGERSIAGSYQQRSDEGFAELTFEEVLPAGRSLIELRFEAAFNRQLQGLYRVDHEGASYAFTQFEALSARLAFPCFDEPRFKTPYDIWLTVEDSDVALSNAQAQAEERAGAYKRIRFMQTKPLPTYLVALAVGPLDVVETAPLPPTEARVKPVPLRGVATKGRGPLLAHALSTLAPTLAAMESYFGIPYPFDKLDIVAVPDFAAGAMENAGLITFRDALLLLDPKQAGEAQRRNSAFVLAHELAHMWFGDLVTMYFWEDIWLNEGFATWLEYRVLAGLHPEYKGELELTEDVQEAMGSDSRVTARMIRQPIETSHDILNAFDSITYSKGAGVIGMFERYLGAGIFQSGIRSYLQAHRFANASTKDLLDALSRAAGRDVTAPFDSFLTQAGVPLVQTTLECAAGKPPQLKLTQSRYFPLGSRGDAKQRWQIPICARYEAGGAVRESCTLLQDVHGTLPLGAGECPSWVMPNADGAGYYRFTLSSADLSQLRSRGLSKLTARERYVLVHALLSGFASGSVTASDLLASFASFAEDPERLIAILPMNFLYYINDRWLGRASLSEAQRAGMQPNFEAFVRRLYGPTAQRLGTTEVKGESGDVKLLRARVLALMCDLANDTPTRIALARAGRQALGIDPGTKPRPEMLSPELLDLSVRMLLEQGDDSTFQAVYQLFTRSSDATERGRYLTALASVFDARSEKALALALDPALRVNEVMIPLRTQLGIYRTRDAAYRWFEGHFDALQQRVSASGMGWTPWLAAGLCDQGQASRIHAFFAPRADKLPGAPRSLDGALESIELCDAQIRAHIGELDAFFQRH